MLAVRAIANAFVSVKGKEAVRSGIDQIVPAVTAGLSGVGKNGRVAAATVALK